MIGAKENGMGCFCHATLPKLSALLPALNLAETASVSLPQANVALGLSDWRRIHPGST
jgi:hypothetical protein